jgi:hypothetical protein
MICGMDDRQRGKDLLALNQKTMDVLERFREELKRTRRWSAPHQAAFNSWKRHLADAEDRVRKATARKWPRSAWDLAAAEIQRERAYWTKALESARRNPGRKIGTEVFDDAGAS